MYRRTGKVPYLFVFCALLCPYLIENKTTKQITASGYLGQRFCGTLQNYCFSSIRFSFIPLLFIVGIRYNEATFAALIWGGCKFAVFCRCFLLYSLRTFVIVFRVLANHLCGCATLHKSGLEFSFSTVAAYIGGGLLFVVSILLYLCFLIALQR